MGDPLFISFAERTRYENPVKPTVLMTGSFNGLFFIHVSSPCSYKSLRLPYPTA